MSHQISFIFRDLDGCFPSYSQNELTIETHDA